MLTLEDCLALCEFTEDEIDAIAEHEQVSETVALELGSYLIDGPDGQLLIQHMIVDDIQAARRRGDLAHAAHLKQTLRRFIEGHCARAEKRGSNAARGRRLHVVAATSRGAGVAAAVASIPPRSVATARLERSGTSPARHHAVWRDLEHPQRPPVDP